MKKVTTFLHEQLFQEDVLMPLKNMTKEHLDCFSDYVIVIQNGLVKAQRIKVFLDGMPMLKRMAKKKRLDLIFHGYDNDPRDVWEIPEIKEFVTMLLWAVPEFPLYFTDKARGILRQCTGAILCYRGSGQSRQAIVEDSAAWRYAMTVCGFSSEKHKQ